MSTHKEPEWTAENQNRKQGDTTLRTCGWCEYTSGGAVRYGCYLSTSCSLMKRYGPGKDVYWDTVCIVQHLGKRDIDSVVKSKAYEITEHENAIKRLKREIDTLNMLSKDHPDSPPLPDSRVCDYYNVGDTVFIFHENKWNRGVVVSGYRHHDGCVSYVLDDYADSKVGWGCGYAVPGVLKEWEYDYFKKNGSNFLEWLGVCDRKYNGESLDLAAYHAALFAVVVE